MKQKKSFVAFFGKRAISMHMIFSIRKSSDISMPAAFIV